MGTVTPTGRRRGGRGGAEKEPAGQEALSYAKDRRNDYGQNDKASRKGIRRRKRDPHRSDRHRERQVLASATRGKVDLLLAADAEQALTVKRSRWHTVGWRKIPDAPLGDYVESRLRRRAWTGMDAPSVVAVRIDRIRRRRYHRG